MSCDDGKKWECQYCTYLNWPTALKCTMCRSQKPLEVIEEGAPPPILCPFGSEDDDDENKRESSSLICSSLETQGACHISPRTSLRAIRAIKQEAYSSNDTIIDDRRSPTPKSREGGKQEGGGTWTNRWSCANCNTLNWMNASSCKQCNTKFISPNFSNDSCSSKGQEILSISELAEELGPANRRLNNTPVSSPTKINNTFPQGAEKYNSRSNSPNANTSSNSNQDKWTCPVCTYDNWPRSVKCIMCNCSRYSDQNTTEVNNGSLLYSKNNVCVDAVISPSMANLSLGVNNSNNSCNPSFETTSYQESSVNTNYTESMRLRLFRGSEMDRRWLDACCGAVDGNIQAVEEYLSSGGDPTRQLSESEVLMLDRSSAFDIGFTLIHLALRFHQEDVLATLLSQVDGNPPVVKRVPSYAAPSVAVEIRRHIMASIRPRKGTLRCHFTSEIVTFTLPSEIDDITPETQETLFDEILDRDVQKELENGQIINWSIEISDQLNSRLYALWNRSAGDCLLDSILQATWGIFDRDNGLRRSLSDSLHDCATQFYQRWKESELLHARHLNFSLNEAQCSTDWAKLLSLASQPGSSLEQLHIFALAHIFRRPIIVYGVKYVKSFRGEAIGFARYEGVYLPFLWEPSFCWRWPIALGYTRGHFSALVPMEPDCDPLARVDPATQLGAEDINERSVYLPLTTVEGAVLPIQFLTQSEIGKEEYILRQWLDVAFTENGVMVARQRIQKRPLLVAQMVEEWLNHYRRLGQMTGTPYMRQSTTTCYSSEGESDND